MNRTPWLAVLMAACTATGGSEHEPADSAAGRIAGGAEQAGALHYTADLRVMESFPVQIAAHMQVHNPQQQVVRLEIPGGCPLLLLAYRDSARTDVVWDQARAIACTLQLEFVELQPGAQREFTARTDAREILGDSLPDGSYYMTARLTVNDTTITRPLGSVQLAVPR